MEKFDLSKTLLKFVGGGGRITHIPPPASATAKSAANANDILLTFGYNSKVIAKHTSCIDQTTKVSKNQ